MKKHHKGMIKILKDGPYEITGGLPLRKAVIKSGKDGIPVKWEDADALKGGKKYHLCRCGRSGNKPYCDGTHHEVKFHGTETASGKAYMKTAEANTGPGLTLMDDEKLCAGAFFCHRAGNAWDLTEKSANPEARKTAMEEACDCPSGRLVALDKKTGEPIEPGLAPGVAIVEDPARKASGPIWVKGGITVKSAKGKIYERRNRITLCRCGRSANKPFCDGSHLPFKDGDKRVD
jgi:CDGSH-type Zn-finger protein